ncbi:MAG: hypothetical protein WD208_07435 [Dehalococcoidia bacterium]
MNQAEASESEQAAVGQGALAAVRQRWAFITSLVMWVAMAGGLLLLAGYFVVFFNLAVDAAAGIRGALGLPVPGSGPDWPLLGVMGVVLAVPAGVAIWLLRWYRRVWNRRLRQAWSDRSLMKRHSRIRALPAHAGKKRLRQQSEYLSALIASPNWGDELPERSALSASQARNMTPAEYRSLAEQTLQVVEKDISQRAIATGLIVGLGPSKLDRGTIVLAALEMQLQVLSRLGKRPSRSTWMEMLKRTSSSLFFNTFLNREDVLIVELTIQKMALGLAAVGELAETAAESLTDIGDDALDDLSDSAAEFMEGIPMAGAALKSVAGMTLGVGALSFQQLSDLTRETGKELLQGAIAGGVLYHHGMSIAADALALDKEHRNTREMNRSPREGAIRVANVAGQMLRNQVRRFRNAWRERRRKPVTFAGRQASRLARVPRVPKVPRMRRRRQGVDPDSGQGES